MPHALRPGAALAAVLACATACTAPGEAPSPGGGAPSDAATTAATVVRAWQEPYRPGRDATAALPDDPRAVVVLVPGGGWATADPTGLGPLADHLTRAGLATVTITYGTSSTDDHFPVPADDVACAVAFAAVQVPDVPVVVLGHSAGGHLAALVALVPDRDASGCPHAAHAADAVVGLAGPYDVLQAQRFARDLVPTAPADDAATWSAANPLDHAGERPEVPFLLVHGSADRVVPPSFTAGLADALRAGGHDVTLEMLDGIDHHRVIAPDVVGDVVVDWVGDAVEDRAR